VTRAVARDALRDERPGRTYDLLDDIPVGDLEGDLIADVQDRMRVGAAGPMSRRICRRCGLPAPVDPP
jgi:hypothetical protein